MHTLLTPPQLEHEEPLQFSLLYAMDGNNSLKRVARIGERAVADQREFTESDYFIPTEFVERFANEVRGHQTAPDNEVQHLTTEEEPGENTQLPPGLANCTENWKAAQADSTKKAWAIFDETGIFAGACRHGIMLWIIDMKRSGEL